MEEEDREHVPRTGGSRDEGAASEEEGAEIQGEGCEDRAGEYHTPARRTVHRRIRRDVPPTPGSDQERPGGRPLPVLWTGREDHSGHSLGHDSQPSDIRRRRGCHGEDMDQAALRHPNIHVFRFPLRFHPIGWNGIEVQGGFLGKEDQALQRGDPVRYDHPRDLFRAAGDGEMAREGCRQGGSRSPPGEDWHRVRYEVRARLQPPLSGLLF